MIQKTANSDKVVAFLGLNNITNPYGISALLGNMYAESGVNPRNLQNSYNTKWGVTDEEYIRRVDNDTWRDPQGRPFGSDRGGFGLCQWTSVGRKTGLYNYTKSVHSSIGDMEVQLNWLLQELKSPGYKKVLYSINNCESVKECSDVIVKSFERPKNQSDAALNRRAGYGEAYYELYFKEANKVNIVVTPSCVSTTYTVAPGDTLTKIASKFHVKLSTIVDDNNIADPNKIRVGQKIVINKTPQSSDTNLSESDRKPEETKKPEPVIYQVQKGDSLRKIGKKLGVPWKDIAKLNNIKWPYIIRTFQILKIK